MKNNRNLIITIIGIIITILLTACGGICYLSVELIGGLTNSEYADSVLKHEKKTDPNNVVATPALPSELRSGFLEIAAETSKIRGLSYNENDVLFQFISGSELREKMKAEDPEMIDDGGLSDEDLFWKAFRVIPYEMDLTDVLTDYYSDEILGFYDPAERKFYIVSNIPKLTLDNSVTISHEFTHFLQDRAFNFDSIETDIDPTIEGNEDIYQAYTALVEGDATLTMLFYLNSLGDDAYEEYFASMDDSGSSNKVPRIIEDSVGFQYNDGMLFVLQLFYENYNFSLVDAAFGNIPKSTEQILHPEKYLGPEIDDPTVVTISASELSTMESVLGNKYRQVYTKYAIGELDTKLILQDFMDGDTAKEAAAGWDGNATAFYLNDETHEYGIYWKSVWDTEADVTEFIDAINIYVEEAGHSSIEARVDGNFTHVLIYGDLN